MSPAALVPFALLGLTVLRMAEERKWTGWWRASWPAIVLLALAVVSRVHVPEHDVLQAHSWRQFVIAAGRLLGWPHPSQSVAAIPMNLPLMLLVFARWKHPALRENTDFVVTLGGWVVGVALAAAWSRGGSAELSTGVPSRYVDFIALLPLVNAWCAIALARRSVVRWPVTRSVAAAWGVFVLVGWAGLSAEVVRGIVIPRARDREAPVRLARSFQLSGDPAVFVGQPLLLVPYPNPEAITAVLNDPRLRGALPPSFQPERPMGPLSRAARMLLGHPYQ
jgi:hypothetical protein